MRASRGVEVAKPNPKPNPGWFRAAVPRSGESCPQATTAASRVWTATRKRRGHHVSTIAALPTDIPNCVITNANSRLRQLVTAPRIAKSKTAPTALQRARRTPLPLTPSPPHSRVGFLPLGGCGNRIAVHRRTNPGRVPEFLPADPARLLEPYYSSSILVWLRPLKSFPSAFPTSLPLLLAGVPDAVACRPSSPKLSLANSNVRRSVSSWTSSTKPSGQFLKPHFVARGGRGRSADSRF